MEKYLANSLSGSSAKVLLAVLLTRQLEAVSVAEFAKTLAGLDTEAIGAALAELSAHALVAIVPQAAYKSLVPVHGVGTNAEKANEETSTVPDGLVLEEKIQGTVDLIDAARRADESKRRQLQLPVVVAVWQGVFPNHKLLNGTANKWLDLYKSAEFIVGVITRVGEYQQDHPIRTPFTYVEGALKREAEKKQSVLDGDGEQIPSEMWNLVKLGRKQRGYED